MRACVGLSIWLTLLLGLCGCATTRRDMESQDISIFLMDHEHPLISESLARQIVILIVKERYPVDRFESADVVEVLDNGDVWLVKLKNALVEPGEEYSSPDRIIRSSYLFVKIRKDDGAIVSIR